MNNDKIFSSINKLKKYLKSSKYKNKTIVHCHGVFDIIHTGHIEYFKKARKYGDLLVVTITSDRFVKKGKNRPYYNTKERLNVLSALSTVDYLCVSDEETPKKIIKILRPNFYIKGKDYSSPQMDVTGNIIKEKKLVEDNGGKFITLSEKLYSSTSYFNDKIRALNNSQKKYLKVLKNKISEKKIINYFEIIKNTEVLLIGESIIDQYVYSNVLGKAGKDPILTINPFKYEEYLGGILSIANILSNFCKKITVVTYLGEEKEIPKFINSKLNKNIVLKYVRKKNSPTIRKTRYVDKEGKSKIIGIYDINDQYISALEENRLEKILKMQLKKHDNVIVADYGHGLLTNKLISFITKNSKKLSINTQLNSSNFGYHTISKYKKANIVCVHEGELRQDLRSPNKSIDILAKELSKKLNSSNIFITQGSNGALSYKKNEIINCPAFANEVVDKVGAGDSFLSIVSLCYFVGMPNMLSLFIGNFFGSIAVTSIGNSVIYDRKTIIKSIISLIK